MRSKNLGTAIFNIGIANADATTSRLVTPARPSPGFFTSLAEGRAVARSEFTPAEEVEIELALEQYEAREESSEKARAAIAQRRRHGGGSKQFADSASKVSDEIVRMLRADLEDDGQRRIVLEVIKRVLRRTEQGTKEAEADVERLRGELEVLEGKMRVTNLVSDQHVAMKYAAELWQDSYGKGYGEEGAFRLARAVADATDLELLNTHDAEFAAIGDRKADEEGLRNRFGIYLMFLARWAGSACATIHTSHTYAAALMCSDVHAEALEDIRPQWPAFRVHVPTDMIRISPDHPYEIRTIDVLTLEDGTAAIWGNAGGGFRVFYAEGRTLGDALAIPVYERGDDERCRLATVCQRLVAGLILAMLVNRRNYRERDVRGSAGSKRTQGEPGHRLIVVGAPIKVDARPAVAAFLAGEMRAYREKRREASVHQWLVRGHFRKQRHGPRRSLSKIIWILPFWKGAADAPIIASARHVEGDAPSRE